MGSNVVRSCLYAQAWTVPALIHLFHDIYWTVWTHMMPCLLSLKQPLLLGGWLSKGPSGDINDTSEGLWWDWQCIRDPCESDAPFYTMSASWGPKHRRLTQAPMLMLLPLLFCSSVSSTTHCHHHISAPLFPPTPTPPQCQPLPPLPFSLSLPLRPVFLFKLLLFPSFSF